jgi:TolA-binding protein
METTSFYMGSVCGLVLLGLICVIYVLFKQAAKIKELDAEARLKTLSSAEQAVSVYTTIERIERDVHNRIDNTQVDLRLMGEKIVDMFAENLNTLEKETRSEIDSRLDKLEAKLTKKPTAKKPSTKKPKADAPLNS